MKTRPVDPGFPPPADPLLHSSLEEAYRHIRLESWRLIPLRLSQIKPRENIAWLREDEFRDWKQDLIAKFTDDPSSVPPIIVHKNRQGKFIILDGHHRWRAATLSPRKALWVVETKGRLIDPGLMERQRLWK